MPNATFADYVVQWEKLLKSIEPIRPTCRFWRTSVRNSSGWWTA